MSSDLPYQVALTMIPQIGPVYARALAEAFDCAKDIFCAPVSSLQKVEGLTDFRIRALRKFKGMDKAEEEAQFISKNNIRTLYIKDSGYPQRLLNCPDAPVLLYVKGDVALNNSRVVAVIGTRVNTDYGRRLTEKLIEDLNEYKVLVLSGLAFGIDALAHRAALKNGLPTAAVLAHGLDLLYPPQHAGLARDMIGNSGALITEFRSGTQPDRHNFPSRNRIVAGMCDAVIVIETGDRGGSLITAELANGYNRDVFAFPGRTTDHRSAGCNELIRQNKAVLIRSAADMVEHMNWSTTPPGTRNRQRQLFIELSENEKRVYDLLENRESVDIDELNWKSGISASAVAAAILNLELKNLIVSLPGKRYRLA